MRRSISKLYERLPLPARDSDVIDLDAERALLQSRSPRKRQSSLFDVSKRSWTLWSGGLLVTIVVHSLLITSLVLGSGKIVKRPPLREGFHAVDQNVDGTEFVSAMVIVRDKSIQTPDEDNNSAYQAQSDAAQRKSLEDSLAIASTVSGVPQIPTLEETDPSARATDEASGDGAQVAALFGIYMGQVKARIERAWSFPVGAAKRTFHCKAQIKQSRKGDVEEITLQQCDMNGDWQASLIKAIQSASPLSAPPSEKVFTEVVTLNFTAELHAQDAATHLAAKSN